MARRSGDAGASIVEYALLIALIAVVALLSLFYLGHDRSVSLSRSASAIGANQ